MIKNRRLLLVLITFLLVEGCGYIKLPDSIQSTNSFTSDSSFIEVFVNDQNCAPPCWQGLKPGIATIKDTELTLKSLDFLDSDIVLEEFEGYQFEKRISFHSQDGKWTGMAYFDNDILYAISFGGKWLSDFEQIANYLVKPTSVLVIRDHLGGLLFYVIEREPGIMFAAGSESKSIFVTKRIDPETPVVAMAFFDPEQLNSLYLDQVLLPYFLEGNPWTNSIQPWLGYGTIPDRYEVTSIRWCPKGYCED